MTCVSMGNPHAVVFIDQDVKEFPLETVGVKFENHERFPKRVNTEFVNVLDRHTAQMRVWERGSGETLACGTGACAVAVACALNGLTEDEVTVKLLGGDLQIKWDRENRDGAALAVSVKAVLQALISVAQDSISPICSAPWEVQEHPDKERWLVKIWKLLWKLHRNRLSTALP